MRRWSLLLALAVVLGGAALAYASWEKVTIRVAYPNGTPCVNCDLWGYASWDGRRVIDATTNSNGVAQVWQPYNMTVHYVSRRRGPLKQVCEYNNEGVKARVHWITAWSRQGGARTRKTMTLRRRSGVRPDDKRLERSNTYHEVDPYYDDCRQKGDSYKCLEFKTSFLERTGHTIALDLDTGAPIPLEDSTAQHKTGYWDDGGYWYTLFNPGSRLDKSYTNALFLSVGSNHRISGGFLAVTPDKARDYCQNPYGGDDPSRVLDDERQADKSAQLAATW